MSWEEVSDFANAVNTEIASYAMHFILNTEKMLDGNFAVSNLNWDAINFETGDIQQVPDDKRGVYGFIIQVESQVLPPHGYVVYMGIAGRNSSRPLRERYRDYLNPNKVIKRGGISRVIGTWHQVLRFFFAPVDDAVTNEQLIQLEIQLNTALMPPYSENDIDADVRAKRRAWR